jgi:hypothetical protein
MLLIFLFVSLLSVTNGLPLNKNHPDLLSQVLSFKKGNDNSSLLSALADADPTKVKEVIVLVQTLLTTSQNELKHLKTKSSDADTKYTDAVVAYDADVVAQTNGEKRLKKKLDDAKSAETVAQSNYDQGVITYQNAVDTSKAVKDTQKTAKNTANGVLASAKTRLESEISSLTLVITTLNGVLGLNTFAPTASPISLSAAPTLTGEIHTSSGYTYVRALTGLRNPYNIEIKVKASQDAMIFVGTPIPDNQWGLEVGLGLSGNTENALRDGKEAPNFDYRAGSALDADSFVTFNVKQNGHTMTVLREGLPFMSGNPPHKDKPDREIWVATNGVKGQWIVRLV